MPSRQAIENAKPKLQHRPKIVVRGKELGQPRDVAFFSDDSVGYLYGKNFRNLEFYNITAAPHDLDVIGLNR